MKRFLILMLLCHPSVRAADWFPVNAVMDGKAGSYVALPRAQQPWRICALLPHARDKYWWAVSWGLANEAVRLNVRLGIYQAGGYQYLAQQRRQFADCLALKADAIILSAIATDDLSSDIARAVQQGVPVIDLVNGVSSKEVAARSLVSFADMSAAAVRHLLADAAGRPVKVLWLPGPKDANWVRDAERGLQRAIQGKAVELIHGGYAPTDPSSQMTLVREAFKKHSPDYVLGNAVAAEAASTYLSYGRATTAVIAYYASEPVIALIRKGRILAAPSDATVLQSRIALDLAVRVLERKPYALRVAPEIVVLTALNVGQYDMSWQLAPENQRFLQQALPER